MHCPLHPSYSDGPSARHRSLQERARDVGVKLKTKVYSLDPKYSKDRQAWRGCSSISVAPFVFAPSLLFSALSIAPLPLVIPCTWSCQGCLKMAALRLHHLPSWSLIASWFSLSPSNAPEYKASPRKLDWLSPSPKHLWSVGHVI